MRSKATDPEPQSYSVAEAAAALGKSKQWVRTSTENGILDAFTRGGNWKLPFSAVEALLHEDDNDGQGESDPPSASPIQERVRQLYGEDRLFLSIGETAEVLEQFSVPVVRSAVRRGQIPSRKIGGRSWVLVADLAGWVSRAAA